MASQKPRKIKLKIPTEDLRMHKNEELSKSHRLVLVNPLPNTCTEEVKVHYFKRTYIREGNYKDPLPTPSPKFTLSSEVYDLTLKLEQRLNQQQF